MAKPSFLTSELWVLLAAAAAVLLAAAFADNLGGPAAWVAVAVVLGAYMLSRGAAKSFRGPARRAPAAPTRVMHAPAKEAVADGPPPEGMTLSEERLYVDKRERPRERVRLTKYVVTEEVTVTVPVRREEVRIERVPLTGDEVGLPGDDDGTELTLMEEEPVVQKRVTPRERVRLEKDVHVEERHVSESLRREEIDIEREGPR